MGSIQIPLEQVPQANADTVGCMNGMKKSDKRHTLQVFQEYPVNWRTFKDGEISKEG